MKFKSFILFFLIILAFVSQPLLGQNISYSFSPRLWGLDFFLYINDFPSKIGSSGTLQMILGIGGGWESYGYFRDSLNNPVSYIDNPPYAFYFNRINVIGTFGIAFLFLYNETYGKYLSNIRLKFILDYQSYEQISDGKSTYLSQTNLEDKEGIFQNSFLIEYYFDLLKYSSKFHSIKGLDLLISYEIYPEFINQVANFSRLKIKLRGFLPLLESENFTIYLADRVFYNFIPKESQYIPVSALTSGSLGYSMRGINWCQYEGTNTLINNFDIRIFLPKIFNQSYVIPGFILFFDCGLNDYENLNGNLDFSLIQFSTGAGIVITVMGIDLIDFYLDYNINDASLTFKLRFALFF